MVPLATLEMFAGKIQLDEKASLNKIVGPESARGLEVEIVHHFGNFAGLMRNAADKLGAIEMPAEDLHSDRAQEGNEMPTCFER